MKRILTALFCLLPLLIMVVPVTGEPREIGSWENRLRRERGTITIMADGKEIYVIKEFKTGITVRQPVKISRQGKRVAYKPTNDQVDEYYIVDQDNNLEIWDRLGLKQTIAPKYNQ